MGAGAGSAGTATSGQGRGRISGWADGEEVGLSGDGTGKGRIPRGVAPDRLWRSRRTLQILAILLLVTAGAVSTWLYLSAGKRFAWLPPGSYIGVIDGVFANRGSAPFYLERSPDSDEMFTAVLLPGWEPQIRSNVLLSASDGRSDPVRWYLPLLVSDGKTQIELFGGDRVDSGFLGKAENISEDRLGTWRLEPLRSPPVDMEATAAEVRRWLTLRAEWESVRTRREDLVLRLPAQRQEIEKLSALLVEGQELRTRANSRFASVKSELEQEQRNLERERKEVRSLEEALEISQKVTPHGRLVGLARESLDREGRIIESMIRAREGTTSEDLEQEYQRAQEALRLQAEINELRVAEQPGRGDSNLEEMRGSLRPNSVHSSRVVSSGNRPRASVRASDSVAGGVR